jgi:hypothetical protein
MSPSGSWRDTCQCFKGLCRRSQIFLKFFFFGQHINKRIYKKFHGENEMDKASASAVFDHKNYEFLSNRYKAFIGILTCPHIILSGKTGIGKAGTEVAEGSVAGV